jgi:hypothetical protein
MSDNRQPVADTPRPSSPFGDMPTDEFRRHAHTLVEWAAGYFEQIETHAVLSQVKPGDLQRDLPGTIPGSSPTLRSPGRRQAC